MLVPANRRVLVIDDMESIQRDFAKALAPTEPNALAEIEQGLFGPQPAAGKAVAFELSFASQGLEGVERAREALQEARPYALAFVDVRMPPGLDGIETIVRLWDVDPRLEIVICTAYSDYSWSEMLERLQQRKGQFLVLSKPFDGTVVKQMALGLTEKWSLSRVAERSNAVLESLVLKRTQELSGANQELKIEIHERSQLERRVRHSQKLEALGRLVGGVAHEINNPLTVVLANLSHLKEELKAVASGGDARIQSLVDITVETKAGAKRIQQIVSSLRAFSQTEQPRAEDVDLRATMEFALRMAGAYFPASLQVTSHCDDSLPAVTGSPGQLLQVFLNLIINAAQAMALVSESRRKLEVSIRRGSDERVVVTVADQGVGISPQDLPKVFDPFFTTRDVGSGTGLGLSVCHGFIEELGGEISIDSKLGEGTVVKVGIPLRPPRIPVVATSPLGRLVPDASAPGSP
jgi:two-component system, NtrC family, sensor kinase